MYPAHFLPANQTFSTHRGFEDFVLNKVAINQAIDAATSDLYKRIIMKLYALDGWDEEHIAERAGSSRDDISQTIKNLEPNVSEALLLKESSIR